MASIAYLGPEGTFTEAAMLRMLAEDGLLGGQQDPARTVPQPMESTPAALEAVRSGTADFACVPIENSIEGSVLPTLDALAGGTPLQIYAELTLDVTFSIVTRPASSAAEIRTVAAYPMAAAQVRRWLADHLPGETFVCGGSRPYADALLLAGRRHLRLHLTLVEPECPGDVFFPPWEHLPWQPLEGPRAATPGLRFLTLDLPADPRSDR